MVNARNIHYHPSIPDLTPEEIEAYRAEFIQLCPEPSEVYWNEERCRYTARPGRAKQMTMKYHYLFVCFILGQRQQLMIEKVFPRFPQQLRRKWTGPEVQDWIDRNVLKRPPFGESELGEEVATSQGPAQEKLSAPKLFGGDG